MEVDQLGLGVRVSVSFQIFALIIKIYNNVAALRGHMLFGGYFREFSREFLNAGCFSQATVALFLRFLFAPLKFTSCVIPLEWTSLYYRH